jgi:broad specificity phosphatase PhoE
MSADKSASATRITFITHAATGIFPADEGLDDATVATLTAMSWEPPSVQRNWVSPEGRVLQTAESLGLESLVATELRECGFGIWAGRSLEQVFVENPSGASAWLVDLGATPHGGESYRQLIRRVGLWMEGQHGSGHAIVVTHASIVRAAILHALNAPEEAFRRVEVAPLTVTDLRLNGAHWQVRAAGVPLALHQVA